MKVAVISDVHGNLAALESVLSAIDEAHVDQLWFLGDAVDYGARPEECVQMIKKHADVTIAGNHDLAALGRTSLSYFREDLLNCIAWTREQLSDDSVEWLGSHDCSLVLPNAGLFHGSPRDPVWEYVTQFHQMEDALKACDRRFIVVGHSHIGYAMRADGDKIIQSGYQANVPFDLADHRFLFNPGSVGQPRTGDPRASFLILDLEQNTGTIRRVSYDIERTVGEILAAGIAELFAYRLREGL